MIELRTGLYGQYYGDIYGVSSNYLTDAQMRVNAVYIYNFLSSKGWTVNAIAGMLGNMEAESTINPGRWEGNDIYNFSGGYGLVQWTPATNFIDWANSKGYDASSMDANIERILYEVESGLQWIAKSEYPLSFEEFTKSTESVDYLARAFLLDYERPKDQSENVQIYRSTLAGVWYEYLTGYKPPDTPITPSKNIRRKFKFLLFQANRRRNQWTRNNLTH